MTTEERPRPGTRMPETDDFPTGPEVGTALPDFSLPDQHGRTVTFSEARNGGQALVVFIRATEW